jgi:hypothetical protein
MRLVRLHPGIRHEHAALRGRGSIAVFPQFIYRSSLQGGVQARRTRGSGLMPLLVPLLLHGSTTRSTRHLYAETKKISPPPSPHSWEVSTSGEPTTPQQRMRRVGRGSVLPGESQTAQAAQAAAGSSRREATARLLRLLARMPMRSRESYSINQALGCAIHPCCRARVFLAGLRLRVTLRSNAPQHTRSPTAPALGAQHSSGTSYQT